ncbi:cupin domain-containing protein [Phaeodactylibacter luteus]|uniref:Cupin domain-containing protein n=1 Tax=Phaeodactylibacter luteus TaxID=1564516 RepID=A0A5C6S4V0_9BACT|nr:cupin domain-containing protein [Phaeodactylibacter luteus]TXB69485.1 cupin domain-containing protein [Phaeodactylibacter luteus]
MPDFIQKDKLPLQTLLPGFTAQMVHTGQLSIAHVNIEMGSVLPEHQHPHEQVTNIIEGELEMTVGGVTKLCKPGTSIVIPGGTPHSAVAKSACYVIDVFCPEREDYKL